MKKKPLLSPSSRFQPLIEICAASAIRTKSSLGLLSALLVLLVVLPGKARAADAGTTENIYAWQAEYPSRPLMELGGQWDFSPVFGQERPAFSDKTPYQTIKLADTPGRWKWHANWWAYKIKWPKGKDKTSTHWAWYRKGFDLSESLQKSEFIMLRCEGIYTQYEIWVNGEQVDVSTDGYNPAEYDITDFVNWDEPNELVILVGDANTLPKGIPKAVQARFQRGIADDVLIYGVAERHIADVFVKPSFRDKSLAVEVDVAGAGEVQPASLSLEILDGEEPVPLNFKLKSRDDNILEYEAAWPDPKLWSPESPYLYRLAVSVGDSRGSVLDRWNVPFGFREFWIEGNAFYLNGKKTFLRGIWGHIGSWTHASLKNKSLDAADALKTLLGYNINSARYHVQPLPDEWYEAADEVGMLVLAEAATSHGPKSEHTLEHMERFIKRLRNHPSVVIWSLTNEFEHWKMPRDADTTEYLVGMQEAALATDPTRPVQHSAYGRLGGVEQIVNVHYPLGGVDFPNLFYWPLDGSPPGNPLYADLDWKKDKPLAIGEQMLLFNYDYLAIVIGDELYAEPVIASSKQIGRALGQMYAWNYQACLATGMAMTSGALPGRADYDRAYLMALKEAFLPVGGALDDWQGLRFFAGAETPRKYRVWNTSEESVAGQLKVTLSEKNSTAWTHEVALTLEPGETKVIDLPFPALEAKGTKRKILGEVQIVSDGGDVLFSQDYPVEVFSQDLRVADSGEIGVLEGSPELLDLLSALGANAHATTLEDLSYFTLVILGDEVSAAWLETNQQALSEYVAGGGCVLALTAPEGGYQWLPLELTPFDQPSTISFRRAKDSPVFANLNDEDLRMWATDNIIAPSMIVMPEGGNFRVIAQAGSRAGLNLTPLIQLYYGKGSYVLNTYDVPSRVRQEPAAALLLRNLIDWAGQLPQHTYASTLIVNADPNSTFQQSLKALRIDAQEAGSLPNAWDADNAQLILAGAQALSEDFPAAVARELLESGATVLVHNVSEKDAAWLREVVGAEPVFSEREGEVKVAPGILPGGLLADASLADLTWGERPVRNATPTAGKLVTWKGPVESRQSLAVTGMLQEIPVGQGRLVIDQILWDLEDRPPRMASILLTALHAKLTTIPKVFSETRSRPLALGPYCNINVGLFSKEWIVYQDSGQLPQSDQEGGTETPAFMHGQQLMTAGDVPFVILDPRKNDSRNAIIITQGKGESVTDFTQEDSSGLQGTYDIEIPVEDRLVERIYFFHAFLENWHLKVTRYNNVGSYRINYMDGTSETVPLVNKYNIDRFKKEAREDLPGAKVAANYPAANNSVVSVYRMEWINPTPTKRIRSIDFQPGQNMRRVPVLFGITLESAEEQYL